MSRYNYQGGCHCQDIRFCIDLPDSIGSMQLTSCNCSICEKTGYIHLIIAKSQFKLQSAWNKLSCYQFNQKIAKHYFCKRCGIKSFYQPRSHPNGISVNVRCLDGFDQLNITYSEFDGKNWQKNIHTIT
jgi:hypothetical protein